MELGGGQDAPAGWEHALDDLAASSQSSHGDGGRAQSDGGDESARNEPVVGADWVQQLDGLPSESEEEEVGQAGGEWDADLDALGDNSASDTRSSSMEVDQDGSAIMPYQPVDVGSENFALFVLHNCQRRTDKELGEDRLEVFSRLLDDNTAIASVTKEAEELNVDRRDLRTMRRLLAASALELERQSWAACERRLVDSVGVQIAELLMYIDFASYDIADFKLQVEQKVSAPLAEPEGVVERLGQEYPELSMVELHEKSKGVKKIVQTEAATIMLVKLCNGRLAILRGNILTYLAVSDRSTGECYKACVEAQRLGTSAADQFKMKVRLACTDGASAIAKAERHILHARPGWIGLQFLCRVHILAGCHEKVYDGLLSSDISGLIATGKSLEPAGLMSAFRKSVRKTLVQKLRLVAQIQLDAEAVRFKELVMAVFLGRPSENLHIRATLAACAPGDWRDPDVFLYAPKLGETRVDVVRMLFKTFVPVLFGRCPHIFPRHRWVGALETLQHIGLPMSIHGLFSAAFLDFMGAVMPPEDAEGQGQALDVAQDAGHQPAEAGDDWALALIGAAPGAPRPMPPRSSSCGGTWAEQNRANRGTAREWMATGPANRLICMVAALRPLARFMFFEFEIGEAAFETRQASKVASAAQAPNAAILGNREWPLLLAAKQTAEHECMGAVVEVQENMSVTCLAVEAMTVETQHLMCKLLSKTAACIHDNFIVPFNQFPFKLFRLLDNPAIAADIENSCESSRDDFSKSFINAFAGRLDSDEALMHLSLVVLVARTSTILLECRNAQIRRYVKSSSIQVTKPDLSWISAKFVLRKAALRERHFRLPVGGAKGPQAKRGGKRGRVRGKAGAKKGVRRRGGGGAWRAFISSRCKALGKAIFSELAVEYNSLSPEERQVFAQQGVLGSILHRQGRRAFGMVAREVARAALRDERRHRALARAQASVSDRDAVAMVPVGSSTNERANFVMTARADQHLLRRLARAGREAEADRLWEWMATEGHRQRDEFLSQAPCMSPLALGLVGRPHLGNALLLDWVCPLQRLLPRYTSLLLTKEHQHVASLLLQKWRDTHREKRHSDQAPLPPAPRVPPAAKPSCLQAGVCLCGDGGDLVHSFKLWVDRAMKAMTRTAELRADLGASSMVLRLQKTACEVPGHTPSIAVEGAEGDHGGDEDNFDIFFLIAHMLFNPYRATFRKLTYKYTDDTGVMHFVCQDEYYRGYEMVKNLSPRLSKHSTWVATMYKTYDTRKPVPRLDPRRLQVRAVAGLESERRCFPSARRTRAGHGRRGVPRNSWDAALDALDVAEGSASDSGEDKMSEGSAEDEGGQDGTSSEEGAARSSTEGDESDRNADASSSAPSSCGSSSDSADDDGSGLRGAEASDAEGSVATSDFTVFSSADLEMDNVDEAAPVVPANRLVQAAVGQVALQPRRPADTTFVIPNLGTIRFYLNREEFVAHCNNAAGHNKCRLSRTAKANESANRAGQGRPLGLLVAWLRAADRHQDGSTHVRMPLPELAERQDAREFLKTLEGSDALFVAERALRAGESEEPLAVP